MNRTNLLLSAVALSVLLSASSAEAKPGASQPSGSGTGLTSLSLWGVADPGPIDGLGAGFRLTFPIVPHGLLHARIRDELVLEPGIDFVHYSARIGWPYYYRYDWNGLLAVCGVAWNFWLTPNLALYPKIDLGWWFGWYGGGYDSRYGGYYHDFDGAFLQLAGGLIYRLQSRVDLRVELGSGLLRLGVGIPF